jgi:energy-coupling factor transporter transmembrane protein EcfT
LGVGLIASGAWLEIQHQSFRELVDDSSLQYGPYLVIASGCAIFLVSVIGIVGALFDTKINKFLLGFYMILVGLVFVAQLAGGILVFVYRSQAINIVFVELNSTFFYYGVNDTDSLGNTTAWNNVQKNFMCCGITNVEDWIHNKTAQMTLYDLYPTYCCTNMTSEDCGTIAGIGKRNYFERGCQPALVDFIGHNMLVVGIIGMVFLIGEVLVIIMATCMLCFTNQDD